MKKKNFSNKQTEIDLFWDFLVSGIPTIMPKTNGRSTSF